MPRLTAMLRAFATEAGALNVDDLYLERQKFLQRRKAQKQQTQVRPKSAVAASLGCCKDPRWSTHWLPISEGCSILQIIDKLTRMFQVSNIPLRLSNFQPREYSVPHAHWSLC